MRLTWEMGDLYETYADAVGDKSAIFPEYLGVRNLAEALYKCLRYASWMEVVVGDPLRTVNVTG